MNWILLQVCKTLKEPTQQRSLSIGITIRLRGFTGNADANYLNTSQLERGGEVSLGPRIMYTIPFNLTSNYINKVNIICL